MICMWIDERKFPKHISDAFKHQRSHAIQISPQSAATDAVCKTSHHNHRRKTMWWGILLWRRTKVGLTRLVLLPRPKEGDRFIWREKEDEKRVKLHVRCQLDRIKAWDGRQETKGREWGHVRTRLICGWISEYSLHAQRNHFTSKNSKESLPKRLRWM